MGGGTSFRVGALLVVALLAAVLTSAGGAAAAGPERSVERALQARGYEQVDARCGRPRARRTVCRWTARRKSARRSRCRGVFIAARTGLRAGRRACVSPLLFGFSDNAVGLGLLSAEQDADLTTAVGANVQRIGINWSWVEPTEDRYSFGFYDEQYRTRLAHGIKPIFTVSHAPWWTWDKGIRCDQARPECVHPPSRERLDEWREFLTLVVQRYPRAAAIEIWNEPNLNWFWRPRPDPARYTELLVEGYRAVKAVDPRMKVVGGVLGSVGADAAGNVDAPTFLRTMYQLGARGSMDALAVHPYPAGVSPAPMVATLQELRTLKAAFGDRATPFWVTEVGLTTSGPFGVSESDQAEALVRQYRALEAMDDVEAVTFHTLIEPKGYPGSPRVDDPRDPEVGYGVVRKDLTPKPAYCALARVRGRRPCG